MSKSMIGVKIAVLAANGVDQHDLTAVQKAFTAKGAAVRLISPDQGLVNGWDGSNWGHNFAVDAQLNTALGVDYDALIIPGGQRSMDKLRLTAHTKRFVGSFMAAMKPVGVMGDALQIMAATEQLPGKKVAGPDMMKDTAVNAGAFWEDQTVCQDANLMTSQTGESARNALIENMAEALQASLDMNRQAA